MLFALLNDGLELDSAWIDTHLIVYVESGLDEVRLDAVIQNVFFPNLSRAARAKSGPKPLCLLALNIF